MNKRRLTNLGVALGIVAFFGLGGLIDQPASAQTADPNVVAADGPVVPGPCPDCTDHNAQPGNGPGIFTAQHACDVSTGQGIGIYFLGNPNSTAVTFNFNSVSGTGAVERNYAGTIPAHAGTGSVPTVNLQVADVDRNGSIHLVGTLAGRPLNQTFTCPCLQPTPTTSATTPPSSSTTVPGSSTSAPGSSSPGTSPTGTLPQTGGSGDVAFAGLIGLAGGGFLLLVARKFRAS